MASYTLARANKTSFLIEEGLLAHFDEKEHGDQLGFVWEGRRKPLREGSSRWVAFRHLDDILEPALEEFAAEAGSDHWQWTFPRNIGNLSWAGFGRGQGIRRGRRYSSEEADRLFREHARLAALLRGAIALKQEGRTALFNFIRATASTRGMGSRRNFNLWELNRRFSSPGEIESLLWATRLRAESVLRDFGVDTRRFAPAWRHIGDALMRDKRPAKAAKIAAAKAMGLTARSYRDAREALTRFHLDRREAGFANERLAVEVDGEELVLRLAPKPANAGDMHHGWVTGLVQGRYRPFWPVAVCWYKYSNSHEKGATLLLGGRHTAFAEIESAWQPRLPRCFMRRVFMKK